MSTLIYEIEGNEEETVVSVGLASGLRLKCGLVPVPDFKSHRSKIAHLEDNDQTTEVPEWCWIVDPTLTKELPVGYVMMRRGDDYLVLDDDGFVIAGPGSDIIGMTNDAWTHFKAKYDII